MEKIQKNRMDRLMDINELAEYLGLRKQTIYNWLARRKIPGMKIGKVWRFSPEEISCWLKSCSYSEDNNRE